MEMWEPRNGKNSRGGAARRLPRFYTVILGTLIFTAGGTTALIGNRIMSPPQVVSAHDSNNLPGSIREAWTMIHRLYADPKALNDRKLTDGTIEGMLKAVGDEGHTRYLTSEELEHYHDGLSGEYTGIGITIAERDNHFVVIAPMDKSPAQLAGIQAGDILVSVNDSTAKGETLQHLIEQVRGPEGTLVKLTYRKPGRANPVSVTLKRTRLEIQPVSWTMLPGKVAQIRLSEFSCGAGDEVGLAIEKAEAEGATGIILDLRNNSGGLVSEAIDVSSDFLPEDSPVFVSQSQDGQRTIHRSWSNQNRTTLPVTVLVNKGTASASEIVAAALRDNGRAKLIGEKTFGTGTLINQFALSNGGAALIGTELWLSPSQEPIRGHGIKPDVTVGLPSGQAYVPGAATATLSDIGSDLQLLGAIRLLGGPSANDSYAGKAERLPNQAEIKR